VVTSLYIAAAYKQGVVGTPFEALARDANLMAQKVFEKIIGRKSAA
jgi:hypothetical protein